MIKPGEYIQLLQFFSYSKNKDFINVYSAICNIEYIETFKRLDEIRCIHKKYKSQCENWNIYPNKDLTEIYELQKAIEEICNEFKVKVQFANNKTIDFKKGIHAFYYYENWNITDLIVFAKERKESSTSH